MAGSIDNLEIEDPSTSRFTWKIDNFSRINDKRLYSDIFIVGGYKWRILIYPKGNNVDYLSMFLDMADSAMLPFGWSRYVHFNLSVVNRIHNEFTVRKEAKHQFNQRESDWGFTSIMPLTELYDLSRGYLVNDMCTIEAEVTVYGIYDSKKEVGYVGLKNQGATGYMNSLLQMLFHIPYFRKIVYCVPTENDVPSCSILLALQSVFYKLQYNEKSVSTKELTKSFGWDAHDSSMQQDVQELNRVLCEKIESKIKGTIVEGSIQQLFVGHHMTYIECINVDYKSNTKGSFYDLQLDVKGCKDVYASFDKYIEVEKLEGDNKYHSDQYGLQDAKKGVLFIDFPPVLQLQLKRFEYDFLQEKTVKINDRYEFPLTLDLDRDNGKYLSPRADRRVRNLYILHSVIVHSDGLDNAHYYVFIRPTLSDQWFMFDDERVTKEDIKRALDEQYGGEDEATKHSNAYMLVYIRLCDKEKIICNVDEKDIAKHLQIRLKKEQEEEERKKKEKAEADLYTIIKVARDLDLAYQIGKYIFFDLVDHDKVKSFRIKKQVLFGNFKLDVEREFGIPVQRQRFWLWAKRQNHTYRPSRPLTPQEEEQSVGQIKEISNKAHNAELKLFLEVDLTPAHPSLPPRRTKEDILLFFKLYDPEKEQLRYVGNLVVKCTGKPLDIISKLNKMAGFPINEEIELYEEIKFEPTVMCELIDKRLMFRSCQLEDGDIICYQKVEKPYNGDQYRYPDIPSFLEYICNHQVVHFRCLEKPKEAVFSLELSKVNTYDDVVQRVALQLGVDDPTKIQLTSHNCYSQQPKTQPIKYRGVNHLSEMLVHYNQTSHILYYEILDIPLPELQNLKTLKVAFYQTTKDKVLVHRIRLPKNSTVGDLLTDLRSKVELSHPNAELRLLEVFDHKIYKIFAPNENIANITDQYWTLRAEEIPEEQKNLGLYDLLIYVYHFTKARQDETQIQNFGEPFILVIHEGETLSRVKVRIQKKLKVPNKDFAKWKFAFVSLGLPKYLQDSDVVSGIFKRTTYGAWEQYLGLEHPNTANEVREPWEQNSQEQHTVYSEELLNREKNKNLLLAQEIEQLKREKHVLNQEIEQLKRENETHKSQLERNVKQLQEANQQKQEADQQKLELQNHISDFEREVKLLQDTLAITKGCLDSLQEDYNKLQVERDEAVKEAEVCKQREHMLSRSHPALNSEFSLQELEQATQNFSDLLKIGEGGFGCVYKGSLHKTTVAIKMLNSESLQGKSQFEQEIAILTRMRHPNLVTLIGACSEASALVYEFLPNGSLEDRLVCANNTAPLLWQIRTRIISEVCLALIFLHSNRPHLVVHGDLKPDNILLDANFMSKLSDFGISRLLKQPDTGTTAFYRTNHPVGTFAYTDPEFLSTGELTPKSDVYSFGITILCLLTGKRPLNISREVQEAMRKGNLQSLIDVSAGKWPFEHVKRLAKLGVRCANISRRQRPNLVPEVWSVVEPLMKNAAASVSTPSSSLGLVTDQIRIPSHFICPIFQEIMREPHIAADGFTYEADAIKRWLNSGHNTSPMTNLPLPHPDLIPNLVLRSAIQEWLQQHPSI